MFTLTYGLYVQVARSNKSLSALEPMVAQKPFPGRPPHHCFPDSTSVALRHGMAFPSECSTTNAYRDHKSEYHHVY